MGIDARKEVKRREKTVRRCADFCRAHDIPATGIIVPYEGGHPAVPAGQVFFWSDGANLRIASEQGQAAIAARDVVSLTVQSNVQRVNVGGGRSVRGALMGYAIAGNVGAIVGGQGAPEVKTFDDSRTILLIRYGNIGLQLNFIGGQRTYALMVPIVGQLAQKHSVLSETESTIQRGLLAAASVDNSAGNDSDSLEARGE